MEAANAEAWTWSTWLPIIITGISALIAVGAAWVAYIAPRSAAALAEQMRSENQKRESVENLKRYVFLTLMQERAAPYTLEATRAFNVIDIVFHDNVLIREAWAQYHSSLYENNNVPQSLSMQYFRHLLKLISEEIGMKDIRMADLDRTYASAFVARKLNVEMMQAQIRENELNKLMSQASANQATPPTE